VDVLTPRSLEERWSCGRTTPGAIPIQGGTDLMVGVNFDRLRPSAFLNLNEVAEWRASSSARELRLGAG